MGAEVELQVDQNTNRVEGLVEDQKEVEEEEEMEPEAVSQLL